MNQTTFDFIQRLWGGYNQRVQNPNLSVDEAYTLEIANQCRKQRDKLLYDSDYRMVSDAPWDRDLWATYRQQLRDLPNTEGFPHAITWPTKPS